MACERAYGACAVRSIQIGLSGVAVEYYVNDWITHIEDVTQAMHQIQALSQGSPDEARSLLPEERPYPLPSALAADIGATVPTER